MNFIEVFLSWCGKTECPESFLRYSALSLLAASCGNRIYFEFPYGNRVLPLFLNLYTILIGPSGLGKSAAINSVMDILKAVDELQTERTENGEEPRLRYNRFKGRITNTGLYELMRTARRVELPDGEKRVVEVPALSQVYLIQDELRHGLGHPDYADQLISALTEMAFAGEFSDMTRTRGRLPLKDYSVNWLAGTTLDWLIGAVDSTMLNAGFFGRTVFVKEDYGKLIYPRDAKRPGDWDAMFSFLVHRVDNLLDRNGAFKLSDDAVAIDRRWYLQQEPARDGAATLAVHSRKHALALKFATLLRIAEADLSGPRTVSADHLIAGQAMVEEVKRWQDDIAPAIQKGEAHSANDYLLNLIETSGESGTGHSYLLKKALGRYGLDTERLGKMVRTWEEANIINVERNPRNKGGIRYYSAKVKRAEKTTTND